MFFHIPFSLIFSDSHMVVLSLVLFNLKQQRNETIMLLLDINQKNIFFLRSYLHTLFIMYITNTSSDSLSLLGQYRRLYSCFLLYNGFVKPFSLRYFNVFSVYLKFFRTVVSWIQLNDLPISILRTNFSF